MATTTIGAGTLRRLSRLTTDGHPVLSLYLDLDPSRFPTPAERWTELSALLSAPDVAPSDAGRVRAALEADEEVMRGAGSVAIFACDGAGVLEIVPLPGHVEPLAVVDEVPWLEPLVSMVTSEDWGVAVVSRRAARLFRGGPHALVEFVTIDHDLHGRHARGGWSGLAQSRFQRAIEGQVADHVRRTAAQLARAHRRRPFEHLVVVAADDLAPLVQAQLSRELRDRLAGVVPLDLEHAPVQDIARAVAPIVEGAGHARERELLDELDDALAIGGPASAGLDEVLGTLEQERVRILLIDDRASLPAQRCPGCGRLTAGAEERCRIDGVPLIRVDAVPRILELAAARGVEVVVLHHEVGALRPRGSIAALLRW